MEDSAMQADLPRGFINWIPYLWSRVLFPGRPQVDSRIRPASLLLLIVLPGVLLYPTRSFKLLEPDEGRYAQISREMHERGEWIVPTLQGQPYLDKPPLLYWLVKISYSLFGVSEASARLIPALAIHGAILLIYLIGRRSLGERSALWGALLLAVAPGFMSIGRLLILDGVLTFFVTLSLLAAFEAVRGESFKRGWWLISATACGFGILTKGPIALLLLVPPIVAHRWLTKQRVRIGWKNWLLFLAVALAVNLPWYVGVYLREPVFLRYFFWEHNVLRFVQPFDHLQPIWYYLPILLAGLLPGTLLLWAFTRHLLAGDEAVSATRSVSLGFWLLAGLWCLAFFSVSGCKLPTYILPAFPCLALALGDFVARSKWHQSLWNRGAVTAMASVLLVGHYYAIPWYATQRSPMADREVVEKYCGDREATVICFPRNCDSVAFYLGRDDLRNVRTKASQTLVEDLLQRPRTVVLFTHRHSLATFKEVLPPQLKITESATFRRSSRTDSLAEKLAGDSPWGLCDLAVIERVN
jgi:4-amino-4-deoxy-L-arabinose transferase-like glycosyltransferase